MKPCANAYEVGTAQSSKLPVVGPEKGGGDKRNAQHRKDI